MNPHRRPNYNLWGVYYGPCHQIPTDDEGRTRKKYYVIVRVCSSASQVYCALINTKQARIQGIDDCQRAIRPRDIKYAGTSSLVLTSPVSWLSVHTHQPGGQLFSMPGRVPSGHELVGWINEYIAQDVPRLIQGCKNISRKHKAVLLGKTDC